MVLVSNVQRVSVIVSLGRGDNVSDCTGPVLSGDSDVEIVQVGRKDR